jgi:hypothetical protein
VLAHDSPFICFLRMKHRDVGAIEVVVHTDESVICRAALPCGQNEFCPGITTSEFPDVYVQ